MVLDHYDGIIMSEFEDGRWSLPYIIVHNSTGEDRCKHREFHGETAYHDAARYWSDIITPMIYGGRRK